MYQSKLWKHLASLLYDLFPIVGIFLLTSTLIVLVRRGQEIEPQTLWFQLLLFAEVFFYFVYSWKSGGQTLGMRAWKICIKDHHKMSWAQATLRFFVGLFSILLFGIGLWARKWDNNRLSWMDKISQTRTVSTRSDQSG